jgi:ligand-binding SRPBCC domain-containing protein
MPACQRPVVINADFETGWEFYDDIEGLRILTPGWLGRVEQ